MAKKVAVILSGCGFMDGAEIRESVITLLALDRQGAIVSMFAPNINQTEVNDHLSGDNVQETRNVFVESARIARGDIKPLDQLHHKDFDALVIPGGFGVAKNLSNIAMKGAEATLLPEFKQVILDFFQTKKPIGAICIAPAAVAIALKGEAQAILTLGPEDSNHLIEGNGAIYEVSTAAECVVDEENKLASCAAYMTDESIAHVAEGIELVVENILEMA